MHVYEKIKPNIWTFNGVFRLVDAWTGTQRRAKVFKFKLELVDDPDAKLGRRPPGPRAQPRHPLGSKARRVETRLRPVRELWEHRQPALRSRAAFLEGGSSLVAENVQLLCARHNLSKSDRIE